MKASFLNGLVLALAPFAFTSGLVAQTVMIDYNSESSISDNLTKGLMRATSGTGYESAGDLTYSAGSGLSGSGAAYAPSGFPDNLMYATKATFDGGFTSATFGTYVYTRADVLTNQGGLAVSMGFVSLATPESGNGTANTGSPAGVPTPTPLSASNQYSLAVSLRTSYDTEGNEVFGFNLYSNGALVGQTSSSETVLVTVGSWYYWEASVGHSGNDYTVTASLYSSDGSGTIGGTALLTKSFSVENAELSALEDIYGLLSGQNSGRRGIEYLDNTSYEVIPEVSQSSLIMGALGMFALLAGLRRCRRGSKS
ncbi:MAG: hypothetical protein Q7Q73_14450 [Verrucomicrobiota bacterium JB024]|nr:hypothetical protein [Verrucomicrobiota bacterium JB024]